MLAYASAGAASGEAFADDCIPFCSRRRRRPASAPTTWAGGAKSSSAPAQDGAISTTMVALTMIDSGQDPGTVVFAGIAIAAAGVVSRSAGAGLGSKAEQDVRTAGSADK